MQICVAIDEDSLPTAPSAQQRFVAALQVGKGRCTVLISQQQEQLGYCGRLSTQSQACPNCQMHFCNHPDPNCPGPLLHCRPPCMLLLRQAST